MNSVLPVMGNASAASADPLQARADKAGAQFEAILLNMVFGELERTFSQWPGGAHDAVSKSYDGFGTEALTAGLARGGGVGLGAFIAQGLMKQAQPERPGI